MLAQTASPLEQRAYRYFQKSLFFAARECLEACRHDVRLEEEGRICSALNALGSVYIELGRLDKAKAAFEEALGRGARCAAIDRVRSLSNSSLVHYLGGSSSEAVACGERAQAEYVESRCSDRGLWAHLQVVLGLAYIASAQWKEAVGANERAKDALETLGDTAGIARILNNLGLICVETGKYDEGEGLLRDSLRLMEAAGSEVTMAYAYTELGRLQFKRQNYRSALKHGGRSLRLLWDHVGFLDRTEVARLCELFGSIASVTGDHKGAVNYLQRATTYYAQQDRWREWNSATEQLNEVIRSPQSEGTARVAIDLQDKQLLRYFTTLLGLMDTLECLHPTLRPQAELVTKYALLLGDELGFQGLRLERLSHAARLHDIGLTSMADEREGGAEVDTRSSATHSLLGERVLQMFSVPEEVRLAVRHHHEWYDGSGGPDGLAGGEIPIEARVIAVVDYYVSQVVEEQENSTSHTEAMRLLRSMAGTRFDPEVVKAFDRLHSVETVR